MFSLIMLQPNRARNYERIVLFLRKCWSKISQKVRTFTHEEPNSFQTLGSQFSLSWKSIKTCVFVSVLMHGLLIHIVCVYNWKLGLWWVPGQTQSTGFLGPKVRTQTLESPKYASWVTSPNKFKLLMPKWNWSNHLNIYYNSCCSADYVTFEFSKLDN